MQEPSGLQCGNEVAQMDELCMTIGKARGAVTPARGVVTPTRKPRRYSEQCDRLDQTIGKIDVLDRTIGKRRVSLDDTPRSSLDLADSFFDAGITPRPPRTPAPAFRGRRHHFPHTNDESLFDAPTSS